MLRIDQYIPFDFPSLIMWEWLSVAGKWNINHGLLSDSACKILSESKNRMSFRAFICALQFFKVFCNFSHIKSLTLIFLKTRLLELQVQQAISLILYELETSGLAYSTRYNRYLMNLRKNQNWPNFTPSHGFLENASQMLIVRSANACSFSKFPENWFNIFSRCSVFEIFPKFSTKFYEIP